MHQTKLDLIENKILTLEKLNPIVHIWRFLGKKIVFTNGCFDLLHLGHIDYLAKAADMGDKLIIGLNSDASTSALKGPNRPITDQKSRSHIIASLSFVSAVVLFDESTPLNLISSIEPDVLVKGADYSIDQIVGADVVLARGGEVKTVEYISGYSTTAIESKIKNS
jgi:rfaE bifunctional protein nucleotidyltransferase chain/domain